MPEASAPALRELDSRYDWVGIYWLKGETLVLGPWSGPEETEHKKIPISEGICGAAVREKQTIIVDDVQSRPALPRLLHHHPFGNRRSHPRQE